MNVLPNEITEVITGTAAGTVTGHGLGAAPFQRAR
jgi:hypothetical protein